eukprot:14477822-Heterocapsa_arctica.AAC.1
MFLSPGCGRGATPTNHNLTSDLFVLPRLLQLCTIRRVFGPSTGVPSGDPSEYDLCEASEKPWTRMGDLCEASKKPWTRMADLCEASEKPWTRMADLFEVPEKPWTRMATYAKFPRNK